jgi:hypothetical protein
MANGSVVLSKRAQKRLIENSINQAVHFAEFKLPDLELVELPLLRTTRFDEEALEYEIVFKVRHARDKAKRG